MELQPFAPEPEKTSWFTKKSYTTEVEKKKDFWIGFWLWWGLNVALTLCGWGIYAIYVGALGTDYSSLTNSDLLTSLMCILQLVPWVINIGLILYFAFTRSQVAYGMMAGFGSALALSICIGVVFTVWCFVALSGSGF